MKGTGAGESIESPPRQSRVSRNSFPMYFAFPLNAKNGEGEAMYALVAPAGFKPATHGLGNRFLGVNQ